MTILNKENVIIFISCRSYWLYVAFIKTYIYIWRLVIRCIQWIALLPLFCCRSKTFDPSFLSHAQSDTESKPERKKQQCCNVSNCVHKLWWTFLKVNYFIMTFGKQACLHICCEMHVVVWCCSARIFSSNVSVSSDKRPIPQNLQRHQWEWAAETK